MNHNFNVEVAEKYGLEEAILLENLNYWCVKNEANKKNFKDGMYWTYNSVSAFNELFPYMSNHKISRALKNLEDKGLIKSGNFNENTYDRTKWYAVTKNGKCILQNGEMEIAESANGFPNNANGFPKNDKSYKGTDNKPDNKPNDKPINTPQAKKGWFENCKEEIEKLEDEERVSSFIDFLEYRKEIKKPYQVVSIKKMIENWASESNSTLRQAVDKSIANGWVGLFKEPQSKEKKGFKEGHKIDMSQIKVYRW